MKFIDDMSSSEVDKSVRNPWKPFWLDEVCEKGKPFSTWCKKVDLPGKCFCIVCSKIVVYGSSGKKALKIHADHADHVSRSISVQRNTKLDSGNSNSADFKEIKSVQDSASEVKSIIGLFISEHCLPFTLGPELLKLCKRVCKEKVGLESATLSATSITYATTHGVAEDVKKTVKKGLNGQFISLNLDEATMDSGDKVLNVLAQYYDDALGKCVIDIIGCREINEAPAEQVIRVLEEVLVDRNVEWDQIVSMLMDNCSVMRGTKEGVEPRARRLNPYMLDVDGDTVHKINNAAQKLFSCLEKFFSIQTIASEIHNDIENSPKQRSFFKDIQQLLGLKRKMVLRPISTRFLQFKVVADRINELWDPLRLYYAASLESSEKKVVQQLISDLSSRHKVSDDDKVKLSAVILRLTKQKLSDAGKKRKEKIVNALFDNEQKSLLCLRLHIGILSKFEGFVKSFQGKKPLAHKLHFEIFQVVKTLFSCFIKPEVIPSFDPAKLRDLDFKNVTHQLKDRHLCVGEAAYSTMMQVLKNKERHPWIKNFFAALREGYIEAASMFMKLPINHTILSKLAYIDPNFQRSSSTAPALLALAEKLPNIIPECDLGKLASELRQYSCDDEVTMIDCDGDDKDFRIDSDFWNIIFNLKCKTGLRYPMLSKLVKALLSIFSGPIVEGSFNILNDIIEEDRTRLTNHNYEALLMVKSFMNARGLHSTSMDIPKSMVKEVSSSYANYTKHLSINSNTDLALSKNPIPSVPMSTPTATAKHTKNVFTPSNSNPIPSVPMSTPAATAKHTQNVFTPSNSNPIPSVPMSTPAATAKHTKNVFMPSNPTPVPPVPLSTSLSASVLPSSSKEQTNDFNSVNENSGLQCGVKRKQSSLMGFFSKRPCHN